MTVSRDFPGRPIFCIRPFGAGVAEVIRPGNGRTNTPAAHFATLKYRRNGSFEANCRPPRPHSHQSLISFSPAIAACIHPLHLHPPLQLVIPRRSPGRPTRDLRLLFRNLSGQARAGNRQVPRRTSYRRHPAVVREPALSGVEGSSPAHMPLRFSYTTASRL